MTRTVLLPAILILTMVDARPVAAQLPATAAAVPDEVGTAKAPTPADPLPNLPQLPEFSRSMLEPAAVPACGGVLPGPYFEYDPVLDAKELPQPGFIFNVEVGILKPVVKNKVTQDVVVTDPNSPDHVRVRSAKLDWTAAPRIEFGYRLPSAFGEFIAAYSLLSSHGTEFALGPDTTGVLRSRLEVNTVDFDYASHEWSCLPDWDMKWRVGWRTECEWFDSHLTQPLEAASAGSGILQQISDNRFVGTGPHAGFELERHFGSSGLSGMLRSDAWISLGRIRQIVSEQTTIVDANGVPITGSTRDERSMNVPSVLFQGGLRWDPPGRPYLNFFLGFQCQYWWNVGRDEETSDSRGEFYDQGLFLRGSINF